MSKYTTPAINILSLDAEDVAQEDAEWFDVSEVDHITLQVTIDGTATVTIDKDIAGSGAFIGTSTSSTETEQILITSPIKRIRAYSSGVGEGETASVDMYETYYNAGRDESAVLADEATVALDVLLTDAQFIDLVMPAAGVNPNGSPSPATPSTATGNLLFANAQTNVACITFQLPHNYVEGEDVEFHIHYCKTTSATGTVKWQMKYTWVNPDGTRGDFSELADPDNVQIAANDTASKLSAVSWHLTGTGMKISSLLNVYLHRLSSGGSADTYGADAELISLDVHVPVDAVGSKLEWSRS